MSIAWTDYRATFSVAIILCELKFQVAHGNSDLRIAMRSEAV